MIEKSGPGTSLAPERDLAARLKVSRPTIRAAVEELTRSGLLVRQHGRGTFTSPHKVTQEMSGTTTNALAVPPPKATGPAASSNSPPPPQAPTAPPDSAWPPPPPSTNRPSPQRRRRTHRHRTTRTTRRPRPGLTPQDMESGNFYQLLRERHHIIVMDAIQTLEPSVTNPQQADLMDVPVYSPILQVERTTRDTTAAPSNTPNPSTAATATASPPNSASTPPPANHPTTTRPTPHNQNKNTSTHHKTGTSTAANHSRAPRTQQRNPRPQQPTPHENPAPVNHHPAPGTRHPAPGTHRARHANRTDPPPRHHRHTTKADSTTVEPGHTRPLEQDTPARTAIPTEARPHRATRSPARAH
ncbi:GntR family transcriptional regulator [Streptacidiphilus sp. P02-A3a]|uniref:GntR family transcriptional regulator n=1 Tax=Streptacidiphilus sp. P02-A3a TaxID=2704468 RepID=UPI001CDD5C9F